MCRGLWLVLASCATPATPTTPRPLISAENERPAAPEPSPALAPQPAPSPAPSPPTAPPYYRRETCSWRGSEITREITRDEIRTTQRWHDGVTYRWEYRLRTLAVRTEVAEGGIHRSIVRRELVKLEGGAHRCFEHLTATTHLELRFTIHQGNVIQSQSAPENACLRESLQWVRVPSEANFTQVVWVFDYTVEDPAAEPPLTCNP